MLKQVYIVRWYNPPLIESAIVLEHSLSSPECTIKTYLVRYQDGSEARSSTDMFYDTVEDAAKELVTELKNAILGAEERIAEDTAEIAKYKRWLQQYE